MKLKLTELILGDSELSKKQYLHPYPSASIHTTVIATTLTTATEVVATTIYSIDTTTTATSITTVTTTTTAKAKGIEAKNIVILTPKLLLMWYYENMILVFILLK